jgi:type II secretory pathway component PulC
VPAVAALLGIAACGGSQQPATEPRSSGAETVAPEPELSKLPAGHVWRVQVMRVMSPGLGAFLQRIEVKEKLSDDEQFVGWEVLRLKGDPLFWQGVDLKPGDVILRVNGRVIGHYNEAYKVWKQLATVPSIEIIFQRGDQQRELRYEIHDESAAPGASAAPTPAPAPAIIDAGAGG